MPLEMLGKKVKVGKMKEGRRKGKQPETSSAKD